MSRVPRRRSRHVAVLIESSRGYGRGLIEGISRYSREHGDWHISFEPRALDAPPAWLDRWRGDGILTRLPTRAMAQQVQDKGLPVVHLLHTPTDSHPMVSADNDAVARLGFTHLWEKGLRQFGYCGLVPQYRSLDRRGEVFGGLAEAVGCGCAVFPARRPGLRVLDWEAEEEEIAAWLKELPKPVGVMACCDERGFQVLGACRHAGLRVPEEVAVLGVDNDPVLCDLCLPPLSSIDPDAPRVGYQAAALLDGLMHGAKPPCRPILVPPRKLVARLSTDVLAVADPEVAAALRFFRAHACDGIGVRDVLEHVSVSPRVLERKFRQVVRRTPKAELLRVQVARAQELLAESDLSLKVVAERCGFASERYFSDALYRLTGTRPGAFRRQCRGTDT
jgi:LacI family transcriptional regulator